MPIRIIAIGKKHEDWINEGVQRYQKRLKQSFLVEWVLLSHLTFEADRTRQEESQRVLSRLHADDYVILLDERGKLLDSPTLSRALVEQLDQSKTVVIVIGGAYGVAPSLEVRANLVWSLSPLVFPHQLVRLMLIEQLYRAQEIAADNPYHHE